MSITNKHSGYRLAAAVTLVLLGIALIRFFWPVPVVTPAINNINVDSGSKVRLPWPSYGQSAIGAEGFGLLDTGGSQTPVPIASIAKIITALSVLKKYPLSVGQQGPIITLSDRDVQVYQTYASSGGSVVRVTAGETLSEHQALQAMLLPSANNMADSLAVWAFGSLSAYVNYANGFIKNLGMDQSVIADASGFSDKTKATASDLILLGLTALKNPVLSEIVSQRQIELPVAGVIYNTNWLLGSDGVIGIKTGNTDQAGGCYLFAARRVIDGHDINLIGAVLGQPQLNDAIKASDSLIRASDSGFEQLSLIRKNQVLGYYQTVWGARAQFVSSKDLSLFAWKGQAIKIITLPSAIKAPQPSGADVGTVTAQYGQQAISSPLFLNNNLAKPSIWWRLTHH